MQLSKNIVLSQATYSNTAIRLGLDNTPTNEEVDCMKLVAEEVHEKLCDHFGAENIHLNSFFRSVAVNGAVGGASNSQHCKGQAEDVSGKNGVTNKMIHDWAKENLEYDQIIDEFPDANGIPAWVHISKVTVGNRKQSLRAIKVNGVTTYVPC